MRRRELLKSVAAGAWSAGRWWASAGERVVDEATAKDWLERWEPYILRSARTRYCDTAVGEDVGWLISPFLNGFYYGYLVTGDDKWAALLVDWADAWIARAVEEPDGFTGWPKLDPDGNGSGLFADSLLGEAMALRPVVRTSGEILKTPTLEAKWGDRARAYLELAERLFEKWDSRGCWRELEQGGIWVFPPFGIDRQSNTWTEGYERRTTDGFSHPDNKENAIADWMLALYDVAGKSVYRERAAGWFRLMKSRLRTREGGQYFVWNYWEPAGPWDYKSDGSTRHWVGVHPNGGYYQIDVSSIAGAFEHELVFGRDEIDRLIATNRDFMWNGEVNGAKFQRIDGGAPDPRWPNTPGVLWTALAPYDDSLRRILVANHNPASWGGIAGTPWALTLRTKT